MNGTHLQDPQHLIALANGRRVAATLAAVAVLAGGASTSDPGDSNAGGVWGGGGPKARALVTAPGGGVIAMW